MQSTLKTLDVVRLEVEEFLRGSFLDPTRSTSGDADPSSTRASSGSPIVAVSSLTGAGLPELRAALAKVAAEVPAKDSTALVRLPIDRVFTMKGFGTVVTGTLVAGTIRKEDELEVFPIAKGVRVRGVQVHGESADRAMAGQRTALNLAGVTVEDLARGMMLAPPATFLSTKRIDVSLSLLPSAKPLKDRARVHLHAYTSETIAEVALYESKSVKPGATAYAQLRLSEPTLLLPGDRFIVRQFSPVVTIGGGLVLDASPMQRIRKDAVLPFLKVLDGGNREAAVVHALLGGGMKVKSIAQLTAETGWGRTTLLNLLADHVSRGRVFHLAERYVHGSAIEGLKLYLLSTVEDLHKQNPLGAGMSREELRETVRATADVCAAAVELLVREKKLTLSGDLVHLPGRGVVMKDEEAESKKVIEQAFSSAGLRFPRSALCLPT